MIYLITYFIGLVVMLIVGSLFAHEDEENKVLVVLAVFWPVIIPLVLVVGLFKAITAVLYKTVTLLRSLR